MANGEKSFILRLPDRVNNALRLEVSRSGETKGDFVRKAVEEKIRRRQYDRKYHRRRGR